MYWRYCPQLSLSNTEQGCRQSNVYNHNIYIHLLCNLADRRDLSTDGIPHVVGSSLQLQEMLISCKFQASLE